MGFERAAVDYRNDPAFPGVQRTPGGGYQPGKDMGFARPEVARMQMFKRRNAAIPLLEQLLSRQEGIEGILGQENPFLDAISQSLMGAQGQAQSLRGGLDQLPGMLRGSALASTQGAQVAAVQAARGAGAGPDALGVPHRRCVRVGAV